MIDLYEKAGEKALVLLPKIDTAFIAESRVNDCNERKRRLHDEKNRLLAAKRDSGSDFESESVHEPGLVKKSEMSKTPTSRSDLILLALKEFESMDYESSMKIFIAAFEKQILNIRKGGKKRISGVLGVPVECRAEVIFLTEIAKLKSINKKNDPELFQRGLEKINSNIQSRAGAWAIIRDKAKRNKIQHHIAVFNIDSLVDERKK